MLRIIVDMNAIRIAISLLCSGVSAPCDIRSVIRDISSVMFFII